MCLTPKWLDDLVKLAYTIHQYSTRAAPLWRCGARAITMKMSPEVKTDLLKRLKRLAGQVRGVQKMVEEERECHEILQQLAAVRSAARQTSIVLVREHASTCLLDPDDATSPQEVLDNLLTVIDKT